MQLSAGELDRRITLQECVVTQDPATGAPVAAWLAVAELWAKKVESVAAPAAADAATEAVDLYARPVEFWIRWRDGLDKSRARVLHEGRVMRIIGTAEIGRRGGIKLACEEWAHE